MSMGTGRLSEWLLNACKKMYIIFCKHSEAILNIYIVFRLHTSGEVLV